MKTGIVIINYNDFNNTVNLINECSNLTSIDEIVVVDNNSKNNDLDKFNDIKNEKLHVIGMNTNAGYSGAINEGCKYLISKYKKCNIIISNSDISIPSNNVIKSLIRNIKNEAVGAIMPKILEHGEFKYGWRLTSAFKDLVMNIPVISKLYKKKFLSYSDNHLKNELPVVDVLYGCFFMIKGEVLEKVNYFDPNVFLYYEENILARKLKSEKLLTVVDTSVFVEHKHNATIGSNVSKLNKYKIYKQSQIYYEEHYNNANKVEIVMFKLFYNVSLFFKKIIIKLKREA